MDVVMLESLSGAPLADASQVQQLLAMPTVKLSHNSAFTGKPETRIYADAAWVLKIHSRRGFDDQAVARRWCELQIARERDYQVYHPQRSWLLIRDGERTLAANLTPRLQPLHCIDFAGLPERTRVDIFVGVMTLYLDFVRRFNLRLDEGLSNFALCDDRVVYLDDDIYPWDSFTSFSAMLANWLRQASKLALQDLSVCSAIGDRLQALLRAISSDAGDMVYEAIIDQVTGSEGDCKQALLQALRPPEPGTAVTALSSDIEAADVIGVIADVHANLPALQAVLEYFDQRGIDRMVMLGDVVGYGPHPEACIRLLQQRNIYCIRGNHDHYVAHEGDVRVAMGLMARKVADWTITQLDKQDRDWLGALPVRFCAQAWMLVHGSPSDKSFFNAYIYDSTYERNLRHLHDMSMPVCLHGHSHMQGVYAMQGGHCMQLEAKDVYDLSRLDAALACPGSVGQPRHGGDQAQAAIFYPQTQRLEMLSLDYNMAPVLADMQRHAFPEELIARLSG